MPKPYLTQLAREHRQNQTPAEAVLWQALRRAPWNKKFKRQQPIDRYIVDFYCASAKLVIELDGSVHDSPDAQAYDSVRTDFLEARGLQVLRFRNRAILENLDNVLEKIQSLVHSSTS